ncbi:unnamed protein product [Allacma fusca]|uniref:Uncharacterized protein n=1 Tax=Allacma fusca TaxID=39272 RepID=A0A8J2JIS4_9HEXA|nr:unnamed protein product [Allacma fusca]
MRLPREDGLSLSDNDREAGQLTKEDMKRIRSNKDDSKISKMKAKVLEHPGDDCGSSGANVNGDNDSEGINSRKKRTSQQTGSTSSFEFKKPKSDAGTSKLKHGYNPAGVISLCKIGGKDTIEVPNVLN